MALKFSFWETFAFSAALSALQALVASKNLSDLQKTDINAAIAAVQKVELDFSA